MHRLKPGQSDAPTRGWPSYRPKAARSDAPTWGWPRGEPEAGQSHASSWGWSMLRKTKTTAKGWPKRCAKPSDRSESERCLNLKLIDVWCAQKNQQQPKLYVGRPPLEAGWGANLRPMLQLEADRCSRMRWKTKTTTCGLPRGWPKRCAEPRLEEVVRGPEVAFLIGELKRGCYAERRHMVRVKWLPNWISIILSIRETIGYYSYPN